MLHRNCGTEEIFKEELWTVENRVSSDTYTRALALGALEGNTVTLAAGRINSICRMLNKRKSGHLGLNFRFMFVVSFYLLPLNNGQQTHQRLELIKSSSFLMLQPDIFFSWLLQSWVPVWLLLNKKEMWEIPWQKRKKKKRKNKKKKHSGQIFWLSKEIVTQLT